jgi:hypothetical protein
MSHDRRASLAWPCTLGAVLAASILGGLGAAGCFTGADGLSPPTDRFYFPTGLAISESGKALYVANSDFDLRYNGGTVLAIDLAAVRDRVLCIQRGLVASMTPEEADACNALLKQEIVNPRAVFNPLGPSGSNAPCWGLGETSSPLLYPGPCGPLPAAGFIKTSAIIGAFASGAILAHEPAGADARLFVPVRGDPSITYFDVSDELALKCGVDSGARCASEHRIGENPYETSRGIELPLEPVGIAAGPAGEAIVTAHQTQGAASLVVNPWGEGERPLLEYVLPGLAPGPTELAAVPVPGVAAACGDTMEYEPGFLLTYRAAPQLDLLRYNDDAGSNPPRPFLTRAASLAILANTAGFDSRGVAVDASERQACETSCDAQWESCEPACSDDRIACLAACADIPMRFFVANRAPASLLIGVARTQLVEVGASVPEEEDEKSCGSMRLTSAYEVLELEDTVPLTYGASRVAIGHVIVEGEDGQPKPKLRVFAVAFDSRFIFSYDPEARRIDAIIRTGRGPHALAFDTKVEPGGESHSFLYVAHFTDSYIGVVDLDTRKPTFGSMLLTLGQPESPQESR